MRGVGIGGKQPTIPMQGVLTDKPLTICRRAAKFLLGVGGTQAHGANLNALWSKSGQSEESWLQPNDETIIVDMHPWSGDRALASLNKMGGSLTTMCPSLLRQWHMLRSENQ